MRDKCRGQNIAFDVNRRAVMHGSTQAFRQTGKADRRLIPSAVTDALDVTRFKFNAYLSRVAELNGIDAGDVSKKFTVEPSVTQTLMNTMQESSDFLTRINIVPVSEMKGEKIGIGVTGSIASTTDTAGGTERQPKDFSKLASNKYECDQINFDFYIRYKTLDLWARYQDFQLRVRNAIIKRQSLDLIMAGFNGVRRAETSDRSSKLQRGVAEFSISLATGRADIYTETPVRVSGFKRVIDEQDWTITKVTHFLNNSGFTTSLELEVRLSDVEYETEDDE